MYFKFCDGGRALRITIGITLALLLTGSIAAATSTEPVLLASLNDISGGCWSNINSTKVVFGLNINTTIMWDGFEHADGDAGIYYFDSKNNPEFTNISIYLTNNQNDLVWSLDQIDGDGYCGRGYYEADWIKGNPDLAGYSIDFIRIIIHNLSIKPYDGGTQYISNKTLEFWGYSTPTSTSIISGFKINDLNGNGSIDVGEMGLANWEIKLTDSQGIIITNTTDSNGNYFFGGLAAGTYTVAEVPEGGWIQTFPTGTHTVVLAAEQHVNGKNFLNHRSEISVPEFPSLGLITPVAGIFSLVFVLLRRRDK
jgi:hypothetical protein